HLLWRPHLAQRDDFANALAVLRLVLVLPAGQARLDDPRRDDVSPDAIRGQLAGQAAHQHEQAALGGAVGGDLRPGNLLDPRAGEQDQPAPTLRHHLPRRRLAYVEAAGQVAVDMVCPLLRRDVKEWDAPAHAGIWRWQRRGVRTGPRWW